MILRRLARNIDPARLPRVTIAQRVIDKIVANTLIYETETGESLIGFALPQDGRPEPDLYVLDTIAPDASAVRASTYFEQGDDLQGDIFNWFYDNWELLRARSRAAGSDGALSKWDAPLCHLGDWHKHPGTLVEPSWGDVSTARAHINDRRAGTPRLLVVLATVWERASLEPASADVPSEADDETPDNLRPESEEAQPIYVAVDARRAVRIDVWYMSRKIRHFTRLTPRVVPNSDLPELPPLSWHLAQPERLRSEVESLKQAGYAVSLEQYDADRVPPLEICFSLARRDSQHVIVVITEADYPAHRPRIRLTAMSVLRDLPEEANLFDHLWNASQPLAQSAYPLWPWTENHRLIDLVREVEKRLAEGEAPMTEKWDRVERYLGEDALAQLARKKVAVVGLGSGGGFVALTLAMSGVGHFVLIDDDMVEVANVVRHVADLRDVGRPKVEAVADLIRARNPNADVQTIVGRVEDHTEALQGVDLVVVGVDGERAKYTIDEVCRANNLVAIYAGVYERGEGGDVTIIYPRGDGPCYACWARQLRADVAQMTAAKSAETGSSEPNLDYGMIGKNGSLAAEPGLYLHVVRVAATQADMALNFLLKGQPIYREYPANTVVLANAPLEIFEGRTVPPYSAQWLNIPRDPHCLVCGVPEQSALPLESLVGDLIADVNSEADEVRMIEALEERARAKRQAQGAGEVTGEE
ncbi:MAG: ThiF family adenylyltransferase [Chloroflexi bacterium]|nr:ThiF family adenylyltransferase [Chloroflexota bacterium]